MKGLRLTAGMADGFHSASRRNELGYHFGLSMDSYTKGCSKWVFGAEYLQKYHPYKDTRLPMSQFTAEGGYYYNFLSDANKVFLCYVGGSAMAGYETVNWGESLLYDGAPHHGRRRFRLWRRGIAGDRNLPHQPDSPAPPCA